MRHAVAEPIVVPDAAVPYILFQRTAYLRTPVAPIYRFLNRWLPFRTPLYNVVVAIEARLRAAQIKRLYAEDMQREYATFQGWLPAHCQRVLDVGCGVAGINVLIQRHYGAQPLDLHLLDKSEVARRVFYLFKERGAFYNSLAVARDLLVANGIPSHGIHTLEATAHSTIAIDAPVDLVLSLISWGFHYPVQTYVERVHALLSDAGVLILDLRRGTDGEAVLRRYFARVELITTTPKYERVAVYKR